MSKSSCIPEELVELRAYQIWEKRQLHGRDGTPQSDWEEAKRYLEEYQWKVFWWKINQTFIRLKLQKRWKSFLSELAVLITIFGFIIGEQVRRSNELYVAWQVIATAYEQPGSFGRIRALEFLNSRPLRFPWIWVTIDLFGDEKECKRKLVFGRRWKREPLAGLSAPKAYLAEINLCGANLGISNLQGAYLEGANLQEVILWEANLKNANLRGANLKNANLNFANFQNANLNFANFQNANLWDTNLQGAYLEGANLQEVILWEANLKNAFLWEANLPDADLTKANLQGVNLREANLQNTYLFEANFQNTYLYQANLQEAILVNTKNLTFEQIKSTCFWDRAIYKGKWDEEEQTYIAIEPNNTNFIKELKNDKVLDLEESIDCSRWEKEN